MNIDLLEALADGACLRGRTARHDDLVDPHRLTDRVTCDAPTLPADGIDDVIAAGWRVLSDGEPCMMRVPVDTGRSSS